MSIDELVVRKNIWIKTFKILQQHNINMFYIIDEFQERYKEYNMNKYGLKTLCNHPNREEVVKKRDYDIAIDILTEQGIKNPQQYFN